ncbi:MAG: EthD domain-containing protein [Erythrobacter sp.]
MIKLTFCLRRLPALSREEFQRTWRDDHAPLVKAAAQHLGIKRYVQCHTDDNAMIAAGAAVRGIAHGDGEDFDGIAELWFDDEIRTEPATDHDQAAKHAKILLEDEARFIDFTRSRMFATHENVVIG